MSVRPQSERLADAERFMQQGNLPKAASLYAEAIALDPNQSLALHRLGLISQHLGERGRAERLYRQALRAGGESYELLDDLGKLYVESRDFEKAARCFSRCTNRFPTQPQGFINLAFVKAQREQFEAAIEAFLAGIRLHPDCNELRIGLATLYRESGRLELAIPLYEELVASFPNNASLRESLARARLQLKDYSRGWDDYEARILIGDKSSVCTDLPLPIWDGSRIREQRLLILCEQGIGDEVQFASCFHHAIAMSGHCTLTCSPRLAPIFTRSFPDATVVGVEPEERLRWSTIDTNRYDCFLPAGSLPRLCRQQNSDFPQVPYLFPSPDRFVNDQGDANRLRVGVSWWGGSLVPQMQKRSIPFVEFQRLFSNQDIQFFNLQHGCCDAAKAAELVEIGNLETRIDLNPYLELDRWFDLISSLDLVITVDNSNAHFAGALGIETWLLLPEHPNWRWPYADKASQWYFSMTFFRRRAGGSWGAAIDEVVTELSKRTANRNQETDGLSGRREAKFGN